MFIIKYKKIFVGISAILVGFSVVALLIFGLDLGIDFKGGALTEVSYTGVRPSQEELDPKLEALNLGTVFLQPTGEDGYIVKTRYLSEDEHASLLSALGNGDPASLTETSFNSIGPSVGRELARKAITAVILISFTIICFIAYAFRKVAEPVSSWKYGLIAIATLLHDVIIPIGIFATLSHFLGLEVDTLFVVAVLTILGLSVSDTIVIFDRIRENLKAYDDVSKIDFSEVVGRSLSQSFARSLSTSLTVLLVLVALWFFGPESTRYFALMLTAGMFFGTYSSLFVASPLLVIWEERQSKKS